jgi:hypothetical protein
MSNPPPIIRLAAPSLTIYSLPFLRFNRIKFGGRATVIRLSSGSLAIFSPIPLTADVRASIASLGGTVRYLIAPDIEHHMQLGPYKTAYPQALVMAPEGLAAKRRKQGDQEVPIDYEFTAANKRSIKLPEEFAQDLEVEYWDSHASKEITLLHKPSKTLIEADLLFNLPATEQYSNAKESATSGIWTKIATAFMNTKPGSKGQQRFMW